MNSDTDSMHNDFQVKNDANQEKDLNKDSELRRYNAVVHAEWHKMWLFFVLKWILLPF